MNTGNVAEIITQLREKQGFNAQANERMVSGELAALAISHIAQAYSQTAFKCVTKGHTNIQFLDFFPFPEAQDFRKNLDAKKLLEHGIAFLTFELERIEKLEPQPEAEKAAKDAAAVMAKAMVDHNTGKCFRCSGKLKAAEAKKVMTKQNGKLVAVYYHPQCKPVKQSRVVKKLRSKNVKGKVLPTKKGV